MLQSLLPLRILLLYASIARIAGLDFLHHQSLTSPTVDNFRQFLSLIQFQSTVGHNINGEAKKGILDLIFKLGTPASSRNANWTGKKGNIYKKK